jgi:hypothetical protein
MTYETVKKILKKYIDVEIVDGFRSSLQYSLDKKIIEICKYENDKVKISSLLHEIGHLIHLRKYNYDRLGALMCSKKSDDFKILWELQAWKYAFALAHVLNIPIDCIDGKRAFETHWVSVKIETKNKFEKFYKTI